MIGLQCSECGKKLKVKTALGGKKVKCPRCGAGVLVPTAHQVPTVPRVPERRLSIAAVIILVSAIFACSIWANLSFLVTNPANYRYFPPFKAYNNNHNRHLGAEYLNIAKAMVAGEGFANPFADPTGPTAWMPPVLPTILAGLLWLCDGNLDVVMAVYIFLQVYTLVGTALLVLMMARKTTTATGTWLAALAFFLAVIGDFHLWFQFTHDCWLVLLGIDLLIIGLCWFTPLRSKKTAIFWGACGGLFALINPIIAFNWGILTTLSAWRQRSWRQLMVAVLAAGITLAPWIIRNYLVFGRLIPVKSNLVYELYQSQCLLPDGLLQPKAFGLHPYSSPNAERRHYAKVGEMEFLDEKRQLFWKSFHADPLDYADRVASRFLGATLWYVPFSRSDETARPWVTWASRLLHPLPFLGLLVLAFTGMWERLHGYQWMVIGVYLLYLIPYVAVSYYERYAMPLLGVKVLLVVWGADRLLALWRCYRNEVVVERA